MTAALLSRVIHRFARAENKPRAGNTLELQNSL